MRAVFQRVSRASVTVAGDLVAAIGPGMLVLLGVAPGDGPEAAERMARKLAEVRVFADEAGKFNRSILDCGGEALVVSQFTLLADTHKGRRPSFIEAARPEVAEPLVELVVSRLRELGVPCKSGRFGAHMDVELLNDGPVTLLFET